MSAAALVTIAAAVVVILALAGFLLAIMGVLVGVNRRLKTVVAAIETVSAKTEPVDPLVRSIDSNLASAGDALNGLLESKVGAGAAADLVASVDPLAETRRQRQAPSASRADDEPSPEGATETPGGRYSTLEPRPPTSGRSAGSIHLREDGD